MNFLALVIISEFDYFFFAMLHHTLMGKMIKDDKMKIDGHDGVVLALSELLKEEGTTSHRVRDYKEDRRLENKSV